MFEPIKELGQNFLTDTFVAEKMVEALQLASDEDVIEIGAGHGILTMALAEEIEETDSKIIAVEVDDRLCRKLESMFLEYESTTVVCKDILNFLPTFNPKRKFKILGSLPYYITSPILHAIIKMEISPEICVLLIQKEVAEKVSSKAPDASYLSSFVQSFFEVQYLGSVEAKKFNPMPEVDGGILKFIKRPVGFGPNFKDKYEGFLHKAFSHPRKMLNKAFSKEELEKGNINSNLRAQNLNADEWLNFFRVLNPEIA